MNLKLILGAGLALALLAPSGAQAADVSFSGSCDFKGGITVTPGVTFQSKEHTAKIALTGPCTGGAGRLEGTTTGPISCTGSSKTNTGEGTLTVGDKAIPVKIAFDVTLPNGKIVLTGTKSGSGQAQAAFLDVANGMQMTRCPGEGLEKANFTSNLKTTSMIVSEVGGGGSPAPAPSVGITVAKKQSGTAAARRGTVNVKCKATVAGRCKVVVKSLAGKTLGSGSKTAKAGQTVTVKVKLSKAGKSALRKKGSLKARVTATVPGAKVVRTVTFS